MPLQPLSKIVILSMLRGFRAEFLVRGGQAPVEFIQFALVPAAHFKHCAPNCFRGAILHPRLMRAIGGRLSGSKAS